ncbi:hypothetical protein PAL_GLEAN10004168 [Pteropus alecto]|uniref:Uncharacterized protein n=1 Tax=Pteropus alecto TaxID=9402 RepID=L5K836_PTEAL|nr:hypothetical protein PAL_GLEAN10004168 [Pteropus alecto]
MAGLSSKAPARPWACCLRGAGSLLVVAGGVGKGELQAVGLGQQQADVLVTPVGRGQVLEEKQQLLGRDGAGQRTEGSGEGPEGATPAQPPPPAAQKGVPTRPPPPGGPAAGLCCLRPAASCPVQSPEALQNRKSGDTQGLAGQSSVHLVTVEGTQQEAAERHPLDTPGNP